MSTVFPTFFIIIGIVAGIIGLNDILYKYKNKPFIYIFMTMYIISIAFLTVFVVRPQIHPPRIRPPFSTPAPTLNTYTFSSSPLAFYETLNKSVYTGPGDYYVRAANGKAQFISSEFKYGGRVGDWLSDVLSRMECAMDTFMLVNTVKPFNMFHPFSLVMQVRLLPEVLESGIV